MARVAPEHVPIFFPTDWSAGAYFEKMAEWFGILPWKTSLRFALEIDDFRQSYINKIMDLTDMCLGKDVLHIEAFRIASSPRGLVASFWEN